MILNKITKNDQGFFMQLFEAGFDKKFLMPAFGGCSTLHLAAAHGNEQMCEFLINSKCNINQKD